LRASGPLHSSYRDWRLAREAGPDSRRCSTDRQRILTAADRYLREEPVTITAVVQSQALAANMIIFPRETTGWPDRRTLLVRISVGMAYPIRIISPAIGARHSLSVQVPSLAAAWLLTRNNRYAAHAAKHLRAWFLDPATRMNANLQYASNSWPGYRAWNRDHRHDSSVEVVRSMSILGSLARFFLLR